MKSKLFIACFFFSTFGVFAQFLHLGIGGGASKTELVLNQNNNYGQWYYPNMQNEIIVLKGMKPDNMFKPTASVYGVYSGKQNYMVRADVQFFYNESELEYSNSVDTVGYLTAFKSIAGHQSMDFRYWFIASNFEAGYLFLPTKPVRPYVFCGVGLLTCLNIVQVGNYLDSLRFERNRNIRGEVSTFKRFSPKLNYGLGVRYHSLSTEIYASQSIGSIDIYKEENEKTYESYLMYGFTVRIDLFTFNLSSKATKLKVKELGKLN